MHVTEFCRMSQDVPRYLKMSFMHLPLNVCRVWSLSTTKNGTANSVDFHWCTAALLNRRHRKDDHLRPNPPILGQSIQAPKQEHQSLGHCIALLLHASSLSSPSISSPSISSPSISSPSTSSLFSLLSSLFFLFSSLFSLLSLVVEWHHKPHCSTEQN